MAEYRSSSRSRDVGDADAFDLVAEALLTWEVHRRTGFRIVSAPPRAVVGAEFVARAPFVPVTSHCEVTELIDSVGRVGFTYRTLPGHPLDGEETFLVERHGDRTIFSVSERSRPARFVTRLPGARLIQARINERYLDAAERIAATAAID